MPVPCARCSMPLPNWELLGGNNVDCPACGSRNSVWVFPAAIAENAPVHTQSAAEGEGACFDHPGKRAVAACRQCGRFVCQLCAVEFGTGVLCPSCVTNPVGKGKHPGSVQSLTLYDTWALTIPLALLALFWPVTVLSAPAVAALAIMKWKQPISLVRRNRWRFAVGLAIALLQGAVWLWALVYLVAKARPGA